MTLKQEHTYIYSTVTLAQNSAHFDSGRCWFDTHRFPRYTVRPFILNIYIHESMLMIVVVVKCVLFPTMGIESIDSNPKPFQNRTKTNKITNLLNCSKFIRLNGQKETKAKFIARLNDLIQFDAIWFISKIEHDWASEIDIIQLACICYKPNGWNRNGQINSPQFGWALLIDFFGNHSMHCRNPSIMAISNGTPLADLVLMLQCRA